MHSKATEMAFGVLDPQTQAVWADGAHDLINEYCYWPDQWFDAGKHAQIDPYQLLINDIQFHYPPINHVVEEYLYWKMDSEGNPQPGNFGPNRNWEFFREGVTHYLQSIADDLAADRNQDAAKRLGILLHFLQDTHAPHSLEGEQGTDFFIFDRLLPEPGGERYITPTVYLVNPRPAQGDISGYVPVLQGVTVAECVLRLYSRYAEVLASNRRLLLPIVMARRADREDEAQQYFQEITETIARLSADIWTTVTALAIQRFDPEQVQMLDVLYLDRLCPVQRPRISSSDSYRLCPMVPGGCLDGHRHRHPLRIRLPGGESRTFDHGWGGAGHSFEQSTVYDLPAEVYSGLNGLIGLHDPLGHNGRVDLTIQLDGETILTHRLEAASPTAEVDVPVPAGGELRFTVRDATPVDPNHNNLAWCDLRLVK